MIFWLIFLVFLRRLRVKFTYITITDDLTSIVVNILGVLTSGMFKDDRCARKEGYCYVAAAAVRVSTNSTQSIRRFRQVLSCGDPLLSFVVCAA